MPAHLSDRSRPDLRLRLVAETVSVPGARQFVSDGLADWGLADLVDDAALCVSEMAANAALHSGSRFMDVHVRDLDGPVELAVVDQGRAVPADAIAPQVQSATGWVDERTSGRGLAIVSMIAKEWGISEARGRRRIWATLAPDVAVGPVRPPRRDHQPPEAEGTESEDQVGAAPTGDALPPGWRLVVVPQAPAALSLRIDQHIDEVIHELKLIDSRPSSPSAELAALITGLLSAPYARRTAVQRAVDAAEAGATHVDVGLPMPREAAPAVRGLLVAMRQADELCRSHEMLTVPATPDMDLLREWFTHNMVTQLEDDADPVTYDEWLALRDG
jgi:anti-sigma regulatory factor (Ser/Thr protein kinase)